MKYIQGLIIVLIISAAFPLVAIEKESDAELYLPKEGSSKQLVRVNDELSRNWPIGFTLREAPDTLILSEKTVVDGSAASMDDINQDKPDIF